MNAFTQRDLNRLMAAQQGPYVSILMPTHVAGEDGQQDPIRLKNLLNDAESQLAERYSVDAQAFFKPIRKLTERADFWEGRSCGLALFATTDECEVYRLPVPFDATAVVGKRFYVKPMLPALAANARFYVLSLSQNGSQLYRATSRTIEKVAVPDMPQDMESALGSATPERGLQFHSPVRASQGKHTALFHGHGGESDTEKENLLEYFRMIDKALRPVFEQEAAPLLLAGVEYLLPIYRQANSYNGLLPQQLTGNWDNEQMTRLREEAYPMVKPALEERQHKAAKKYADSTGNGRSSADIHKILVAAEQGQVESLFVDRGMTVWGSYHPETGDVYVHETPENGDEDLLNLAVIETALHNGEVYVMPGEEMPSEDFVAATLRY
ncbi:hypothetical protein LOC68_10815 [Blastopirellula sp. JC732]|uniref:Uncharacterized protein n=1 Tax=Blastopirellula sediminis TaxID=2894196 RepID=A0A9X1MLP7_9BACT|nr:hypothetical protein [Blastopirellula sediminis]MCC9608332.1 hypothetical protein [Blastopirellula sediminis]MCC9628891.1 hypothetical protein [Blastopirellula sediminis]